MENHGSINGRRATEYPTLLTIGRTLLPLSFTKMSFGSLAMFERVLTPTEVKESYLSGMYAKLTFGFLVRCTFIKLII